MCFMRVLFCILPGVCTKGVLNGILNWKDVDSRLTWVYNGYNIINIIRYNLRGRVKFPTGGNMAQPLARERKARSGEIPEPTV
jgi:hypothetical protein